ncbi:flavin reductase [Butyrivibrio sp. LB2008]|uniref:flavin reductase n=1 Tax=Butyrivibrio sp. LB2008 TaxID=1408305 RepID=UPI00047D5CD9|nr:flavin reductase [Butyrivibrio sp. LB2008]
MEFTTDIFDQFDKKWALLTAGEKDNFNTMTISWGGLGTLWNKPVATVYVRTPRYTHDFMDNNEYFTISFYPEKYKDTLVVLGTKSGKEIDKMHSSGLTAKEVNGSMTFEEAEVTLVCKKLFCQRLNPKNMHPDIVKRFYDGDAEHDMYIGEVVDVLR